MANMEADEDAEAELPGSGAEHGSAERASRLRAAVRAGGGNTVVARNAAMPVSTLNRYIAGRDMKASAMIALAEATGVRLEWLATGAGPMREGEAPASPPPPASPAPSPFRLFGQVKIDRLVQAYEGALATTRGADHRMTMHLTVLIHDQLAQAEEALEKTSSAGDESSLTKAKSNA
ncbi:helix-turn-helix domain-containing protein [Falsiroseomonas sp.]|uniref:helix-turn-helix domain-containing protein n=1 Tax=Falsiroseomonas sp. TaxID=2870721 RepID=UPI0027171D07|nr:helix-turn-helix domain-containing protein [Falsiroseomonas sp.]MDO9498999.1 helix-turn-helix domain-containing protein [Falsiroseomonas sp.]